MAGVSSTLKSRFRGCLVGAVAGDCLGCPFESGTFLPKGVSLLQKVAQFVQNLNDIDRTDVTLVNKKLPYTDDTAMARSVAASLIHCHGQYNARDMASRFSEEFAKEPDRGYGGNVVSILPALGDEKTTDVYAPARMQFGGSGSYGNGGAMRVAPVGLCSKTSLQRVTEIARESAELTHSNPLGYNGAILQACAVHMALHSDPEVFSAESFLDKLLTIAEAMDESGGLIYREKIQHMKDMLSQDPSPDNVAHALGNDVSAHQSVPTAIYSFLRCLRPVQGISTDNCLERTLIYAISLDGDTDTIASMAGAIAGALHGQDEVPEAWMSICEGVYEALQQADQLYDIMQEENKDNK